jgi:hypothetical membrane protein
MAAGILCWSALFVFAALRPSYSHSVNAVSELGVIGSPNASLWNVIGFMTPGVLLTIAGAAIAASITSKGPRTAALWLLLISGLAFAGTGVFPAEMRDGSIVVTSASTRGHFIMSLIHGIAWAIGAVLLIGPMRRNAEWRGWHVVSIVLVVATIAAVFGLRGRLSDALVQRVAGAVYFAWFFVMSQRLFQVGSRSA